MTQTNSETLVGRTTRSVLFRDNTSGESRRYPTGTTVYVAERRDGCGFNIRIPRTLLTQHVYPSDVEPY
jgi:hypothetical protein